MRHAFAAIVLLSLLGTDAMAAQPRYGHAQNDAGRDYQTHFDLRQRWMWGGGATWDGTVVTGDVQTNAVYEYLDDWDGTRDRHEFLTAEMRLDGFELDATLYAFERRRRAKEPVLWLTKLVGEPQRFDLHLDVGPSMALGQVARRMDANGAGQTRIIAGQLGLVLALIQSENLEDGLWTTFATAGGVNIRDDNAPGFAMPSAGIQARWSPGERGLWQFSSGATARFGFEPSGTHWWWIDAEVEAERVVFAINDQPFSAFVTAKAEAFDNVETWDFSGLVGLRVSLFSPVPDPPDKCPGETEDFDGFQDDDGCRDDDNDGDGVLDWEDVCPLELGPMSHSGCPQGYNAY